jgi:hypothetical protein
MRLVSRISIPIEKNYRSRSSTPDTDGKAQGYSVESCHVKVEGVPSRSVWPSDWPLRRCFGPFSLFGTPVYRAWTTLSRRLA